jgi:hypothetical protein
MATTRTRDPLLVSGVQPFQATPLRPELRSEPRPPSRRRVAGAHLAADGANGNGGRRLAARRSRGHLGPPCGSARA